VGELVCEGEARSVQQGLAMEGFQNVKVTSMGDKLVLLQVDNVEVFEQAVKDHQCWWNGMFKEVKRWKPSMVAQKRRVWLHVYDIPIHVWYEFLFKLLGSKFRDFLDFDEDTICRRRLDVARIRVSTARTEFIDEFIKIKVVGAVFKLWVVEEGGVWRSGRVEEAEDEWHETQSLESCECEAAGGQVEGFSDGGDLSPKEHQSPDLGLHVGGSRVMPLDGSGAQKEAAIVYPSGLQLIGMEGKECFLNSPLAEGQVASLYKEKVLQIEGSTIFGKVEAGGHTPAVCVDFAESEAVVEHALDVCEEEVQAGKSRGEDHMLVNGLGVNPAQLDGAAAGVLGGPVLDLVDPYPTKPGRCETGSGPLVAAEAGGDRKLNSHIQFLSDDSDCSGVSDSIEDFDDDEKLINLKQRQRRKLRMERLGSRKNGLSYEKPSDNGSGNREGRKKRSHIKEGKHGVEALDVDEARLAYKEGGEMFKEDRGRSQHQRQAQGSLNLCTPASGLWLLTVVMGNVFRIRNWRNVGWKEMF